jgi:hypothetical protein
MACELAIGADEEVALGMVLADEQDERRLAATPTRGAMSLSRLCRSRRSRPVMALGSGVPRQGPAASDRSIGHPDPTQHIEQTRDGDRPDPPTRRAKGQATAAPTLRPGNHAYGRGPRSTAWQPTSGFGADSARSASTTTGPKVPKPGPPPRSRPARRLRPRRPMTSAGLRKAGDAGSPCDDRASPSLSRQRQPEQGVSGIAYEPGLIPASTPPLTSPLEPRHHSRSSLPTEAPPPPVVLTASSPNPPQTLTRRLDCLPLPAHITPSAHSLSVSNPSPGCRRPAPHQPVTRLGWDHPGFTWQAEEGASAAQRRTPLPPQPRRGANTTPAGGAAARSAQDRNLERNTPTKHPRPSM